MNHNNYIKRIGSAVLSLIMVIAVAFAVPIFTANAEQKAANGLTRAENEAAAKKIQQEIDQLKNEKADTEKMKAALQKQVANTEEKITIVTKQLSQINEELSKAQTELDKKQVELESNKVLFKQRLRAMYMSSSTNADIQFLLGSDDMADYLAKAELARSVSEHDKVLIDEIVSAVTVIQQNVDTISKKKSEKDSVKKELAKTQQELADQTKQLSEKISASEKTISDKEDEKAKYEEAKKEIETKMQQVSVNITYSGQFTWPCPGYYNITSGFKWRWGKQHQGIDISSSGITGKPIVAAADGVVSTASYNSGGYGNYVIIGHGTSSDGNSYATLYGHMQSYCVSAGQSVSKGQTIGYVGNTGYSTGPHLHFEIRVNGSPVDPSTYFH